MAYCRYCGKQIDDDAEFCTYCGKTTTEKGIEVTKNLGHGAPWKKVAKKSAILATLIVGLCITLYFAIPKKKNWCAEYIESDGSYVYHIDMHCNNIRHGVTTVGDFSDITLLIGGVGLAPYYLGGGKVKYCNKCMSLDDIAACKDSIAKYNPQK